MACLECRVPTLHLTHLYRSGAPSFALCEGWDPELSKFETWAFGRSTVRQDDQ